MPDVSFLRVGCLSDIFLSFDRRVHRLSSIHAVLPVDCLPNKAFSLSLSLSQKRPYSLTHSYGVQLTWFHSFPNCFYAKVNVMKERNWNSSRQFIVPSR